MKPDDFVNALCNLQFEDAFNPYADRCPVHDAPGAPRMRANVLQTILHAAVEVEIDAIWIGRDLGYRGGRRTGLALTDDVHIQAHAARWGISVARPTKGQAVAERTAAVIWGVLSRIEAPVFLWNVFPLHPHESGDPFTNRSHNSHERRAGEELLLQLIRLLRPRRLIAIGNDAAHAAGRIADTYEIVQVRHPSYGGQTQFLRQMQRLYGLRAATRQAQLV
jgi:hypothetical protein